MIFCKKVCLSGSALREPGSCPPFKSFYGPLFVTALLLLIITLYANEEGTRDTSDFINYADGDGGNYHALLSRIFKSLLTLSHYMVIFFFPVNLRAHYVVNEGSLDIHSSPELVYALGVWAGVVLPMAAFVTHSAIFGVPAHSFLVVANAAAVAYVALFLPTVGIVQHGMIQKGGDRYAYLTYVPLVATLSGGVMSAVAGKSKKWFVLVVALAVSYSATLGALSRSQLCTWCDDNSMFQNALAQDPTDWRMVDTYSEMLSRWGRKEEAEMYLRRSLDVLPQKSIKALLGRAKSHMMLGESNVACDMYFDWWKRSPPDRSMPLLMNNVAMCKLRAGVEAKEEAEGLIAKALKLSTAEHHQKTLKRNYDLLKGWGGEGESSQRASEAFTQQPSVRSSFSFRLTHLTLLAPGSFLGSLMW